MTSEKSQGLQNLQRETATMENNHESNKSTPIDEHHLSNGKEGQNEDSMKMDSMKAEEEQIKPNPTPTRTGMSPMLRYYRNMILFSFLILLVFWTLAAQIYGVFTNEGGDLKKAKVAVIDFDGGEFGAAILQVTGKYNQTSGYPRYIILDPNECTPESVEQKVFDGTYWAAIYSSEGASTRFRQAVNGTSNSYDPMNTVFYVTLQARIYQLYADNFLTTTQTITQMAEAVIGENLVKPYLAAGNFSKSDTSLSALSFPSEAVEVPAGGRPFSMDDRVMINTVGTVFLNLMEIFCVIASGFWAMHAGFYKHYSFGFHVWSRYAQGVIYPICVALSSAGWTFAFRGSYELTAKMFFGYFGITFFFTSINFDMADAFVAYVPIAYVPLFAIGAAIFSISGTLGTPDILNDWYRMLYILPSTHWWETCMPVLTRGGVNKLYYNLPVLAVWFIIGKVLSYFATRHRFQKARQT